ncbi:2OG-Fe(II) oxygenase [Qipengyuania sphaerica]|uniref:2OG-Fe(II) oxygenase n=1 Tax=Qipengyuania sphaerica TaxID=2867243 RepID=UPI001C88B7BA|nr:2OG-Fe(II) oxygenase [Qipengyuania sphaerica]MBX7540170.1 2OG-Fe(II) oxygenase [Qipengyuania sphaerica]
MARTDEPEASARVKTAQVPVLLVDGFMGADFAAELCDFAEAHESEFARAVVTRPGVERELDTATRRCLSFEGELGSLADRFLARAAERNVFEELRIEPLAEPHHQFSLSAHRDGDFFLPHSDVVTGGNRAFLGYDRLVTLTYYAHRPEARFEGGELVLRGLFGRGDEQVFEPLNDRLVAFPSFAPHEVRKVIQPDAPFAEARFALTCWLGRRLA